MPSFQQVAMPKIFCLLLLAAYCLTAYGNAIVHKCVADGKVIYQGTPCVLTTSQVVQVNAVTTALKAAVLNGQQRECLDKRAEIGLRTEEADKFCRCMTSVIDKNYSFNDLLAMATMSKQEISSRAERVKSLISSQCVQPVYQSQLKQTEQISKSNHDWVTFTRGTNVVLSYDRLSLRRTGDKLGLLQISRAINESGSQFFRKLFQYTDTVDPTTLYNELEIDCSQERARILRQWLTDSSGNAVGLSRYAPDWHPITQSADFAYLRKTLCPAK